MKEMTYIVYCTSGLGNRLRPLASAIAYCNITGRKLRVYWDIKTPNGCLSPLSSLFENKFDLISLEEISDLAPDKIKLFTEKGPGHGVQREADRFGRNQLLELSQGSPPFDSQALDVELRCYSFYSQLLLSSHYRKHWRDRLHSHKNYTYLSNLQPSLVRPRDPNGHKAIRRT